MSYRRDPEIGRPGIGQITPDQIEAYKAKGRLERARAIRRALRRLTGHHEPAKG